MIITDGLGPSHMKQFLPARYGNKNKLNFSFSQDCSIFRKMVHSYNLKHADQTKETKFMLKRTEHFKMLSNTFCLSIWKH